MRNKRRSRTGGISRPRVCESVSFTLLKLIKHDQSAVAFRFRLSNGSPTRCCMHERFTTITISTAPPKAAPTTKKCRSYQCEALTTS